MGILVFSVASSLLPVLMTYWRRGEAYHYEDTRDPNDIRAAAKQERMRSLAQSDLYRPEIVLFGLGPWILQTWAKARRLMLGLDKGAQHAGMYAQLVTPRCAGCRCPRARTGLLFCLERSFHARRFAPVPHVQAIFRGSLTFPPPLVLTQHFS